MNHSDHYPDEIDLSKVALFLKLKKHILLAWLALFAALSISYIYLAKNIYTAEIIVLPSETSSNLSSALASFSNFTNLNLQNSSKSSFAFGTLSSQTFLEQFIDSTEILIPLYSAAGWDRESNTLIYDAKIYDHVSNRWTRKPKGIRKSKPSLIEAYELWTDEVMEIKQDPDTSILTIQISFLSPYLAAEWANNIVYELNNYLANRDIKTFESSISNLQQYLPKLPEEELKRAGYNIIEYNLQQLILAKSKSDYFYKVIQKAYVPEKPSSPNRPLILVISLLFGFLIGVTHILILALISKD